MAENKATITEYKGEREFPLLKDTEAGKKKGDKIFLTYELYTIFNKKGLVK